MLFVGRKVKMFSPKRNGAVTQVFNFHEADEGEQMEFHLLYQGKLRSEGGSNLGPQGRAKDKHFLRKYFHLQLRKLWELDPNLRSQGNEIFGREESHGGGFRYYRITPAKNYLALGLKKYIDWIADDYQRIGGRFVPLVSEVGGLTCSLDILFLRRDNPGSMVINGGDIDNRIKVLLDGLRLPKTVPELGGLPITEDENPFFCLLEDDSLITKLSVTTDRLISPQGESEGLHDVFLDIHVTVVNPGAIFAGGRLI